VIDHVGIRLPDLESARDFYARTLELLDGPEPVEDGGNVEWNDFAIGQETAERPATRRLHIGFRADSRHQVDDWWHAMIELGHQDDGPPGPRPVYGPDYYGAFIIDPAGNSVEAVNNGNRRHSGVIDHLWLRSLDLDAASRFYETVCPTVAHTAERYEGRTQIRGSGATFSIVEGQPTENLHLAFAAPNKETVDSFHRAGIQAGYASNGAPGERREYHPGYYGAFLFDPDSQNIEAVFHDRQST
jgi:catechol 2,3-dioxygenase-like lactoylglutathione lyase family enzyme